MKMLSLQINNPMVENFLYEHFKDNTKQMSIFINDFIEKELIKKDIKLAFDDIKNIISCRENGKTLQSLISDLKA
jgi:hypothetical protein